MRASLLLVPVLLVLVGCSSREQHFGGYRPGFDDDLTADAEVGREADAAVPDASQPDDARPDGDEREDAGDADVDAATNLCEGAVATAPFRDQRDDAELTNPATCPGCPAPFEDVTGLDHVDTSATTVNIGGRSAGSSMCEIYVEGSQCGVVRTLAATDPDGTGLFSSTVPLFCGENIVRIVCSNAEGQRVLVRRFMGTRCDDAGRDLRLTLSWDDVGDDLELHLIRPGGRINHATNDCTWFTCMEGSLDWGVRGDPSDDPTKDIDDTDTLGPENVFLDDAPDGVYDVMVEYWGTGEPADATISIAIHEATVATLPIDGFREHHVWHVGKVVFPEGRFIEHDFEIDCETDWNAGDSRGCGMDLPAR